MISGAHMLLYAKDAAKTRAFFRDVLRFPCVDAGQGWLIFALPPAEMGIHPSEPGCEASHEMYLLCDDVRRTVADLRRRGVRVRGRVADRGWGLVTSIEVPGLGRIGIYQPKHPTAAEALRARRPAARRRRPRRPRAPAR